MLFQTFDYFLFLPLVAAVHWRLGRGRTAWLLAASLAFYIAWNPKDFVILAAVTALAYGGGLLLHRRPGWLPAVVLALLAPLFWFKYAGFVTENLAILLPGMPVVQGGHLPIGISFYTFQAIGYVVDTRRGQAPERSPVVFSSFLLFFPHLVAGPILRAHNLIGQLRAERSLSAEDVGEGITRLARGLIKKLLIADVLSVGIVETVILEPERFTGPEVLVALYAYTLQIYCDFSGYTDLAIGSARLLGFRIPENFRRPYQALSVGDYWRRWHITLSDWVRDYVYYPMGGSRVGGWKTYRNTFLTLLILAVWHKAAWTFVLYGLLHGAAVSLNRLFRRQKDAGPLGFFGVGWRWLATFHFVVLARILFIADDLDHAGRIAAALGRVEWVMPRYSPHALAVLAVAYLIHLTPAGWTEGLRARVAALPAPALGVALALVAWACAAWGVGDTLTFVYYEF